jgi:hypothetical protein
MQATERPSRPARSPRTPPVPREPLYPVLAKQRHETTGTSQSIESTDDSANAPVHIEKAKIARPSGRPGRALNRPPKRVDLYVNEAGYSQAKPVSQGHEEEDLHTRRREHLAPTPPDHVDDALTAMVDASAGHSKVSRPPRRRADAPGGNNKAVAQESYPAYWPARQASSPAQRSPRAGASSTGFSDRPSQFRGGPGGPGGRGGPGGQRKPSFSATRRPGFNRPRRTGSVNVLPAKVFGPAPTSVVGPRGYTRATPLKKDLRGKLSLVQMGIHKAQWQTQKRDIEKSLGKSNKAAAVLQGDWGSYIAPLLTQAKEALDKKSAHGLANDIRSPALTRASLALAMNSSASLRGKLEVVKKLGSTL